LLVGKAGIFGLIPVYLCIYIHDTVIFGIYFCLNFQANRTSIKTDKQYYSAGEAEGQGVHQNTHWQTTIDS